MKTHYNAKVNLRELVSAQQKKNVQDIKQLVYNLRLTKYDFRH